nr:phage major capsid protein [Serratia marcescens]
KTLDGMPVVDTQQGVLNKGDLVFGNFDYLYYGLPGHLEVELDKSAQLSTLTNADGTPINLYEQDMVAMKVTMDVAVLPVRQDAFATLNVTTGDDVLGAVPGDGTDTNDKNAKANTAKAKPATESK